MTQTGPARSAILAAAAMLALISAGCSNAPADTGSTGGGGPNSTNAQAVKFAECVRANGVADFPDPNASGDLTIDQVANGSSLDTNSPAFERAITACKDLEPAGFTGQERSPEQQAAALEFAQCVRDNGVKDFPDPADGDPLIDTNKIPSAVGNGMTKLDAAMKKCATYSDEAGVKGP